MDSCIPNHTGPTLVSFHVFANFKMILTHANIIKYHPEIIIIK